MTKAPVGLPPAVGYPTRRVRVPSLPANFNGSPALGATSIGSDLDPRWVLSLR